MTMEYKTAWEHCQGRLSDIKAVYEEQDDNIREEKEHDYDQNIACVDTYTVKKVLLGYGGPTDYFELWIQAGEIQKISYTFAEGGDYRDIWLNDDEFDLVAGMFENFVE